MTYDEALREISRGTAFLKTAEALRKAEQRHRDALDRYFPIGSKAWLSHHYTLSKAILEVTVVGYSMPFGDVCVEVPPGSVDDWRLCGAEKRYASFPYPALYPPEMVEALKVLKR